MTLTTPEALWAWATFLPRPGRPVQDLAVLAAGQRYGGFTSQEHAQWFAERLGLLDPQIVELQTSSGANDGKASPLRRPLAI